MKENNLQNNLLENLLSIGRKIIPKKIFKAAQPIYHYILALLGAIIYKFPSKKLIVIGVTGTKGKSTTTEIINSILEAAGYKTAVANTIRYKIGDESKRNMSKMTMRGRFFVQRFLKEALDKQVTHVVLEMSSESVLQHRHKFIYLDALIFTNLAPEHIENHGSYKNYIEAKVEIAKILETTPKQNPCLIVNVDDAEAERFMSLNVGTKLPYSIHDAINVKTDENGSSFQIEKVIIHSKLPGIFNVSNMLGAITYAKFVGISDENIKKGLENIDMIRGRMEKINQAQNYDVVVDYAHTPDSLRAVYEAYKDARKICVLGNTGGGRDRWKRKDMGKIASDYCDYIILTNEDPYDENPGAIVEEMKTGMDQTRDNIEIIMDRREAINFALKKASNFAKSDLASRDKKIAVLITGKGTDPYIMGKNGQRTPWDDASVAREELENIADN